MSVFNMRRDVLQRHQHSLDTVISPRTGVSRTLIEKKRVLPYTISIIGIVVFYLIKELQRDLIIIRKKQKKKKKD